MRGRPKRETNIIPLRGKSVPAGKPAGRRAQLDLKPLGAPPADMTREQKAEWAAFKRELPWLCESDRATMEVAAVLRAEFTASSRQISMAKLNLYRQLLAVMGGSPRDRNGVTRLPQPDEAPAEYFDA